MGRAHSGAGVLGACGDSSGHRATRPSGRSFRAFVDLLRGGPARTATAPLMVSAVSSGEGGSLPLEASLRVLLITDWMAGVGGAEGYILGVRAGLRTAGDEVALLTSSAGSAGDGAAEYRAYGTDRDRGPGGAPTGEPVRDGCRESRAAELPASRRPGQHVRVSPLARHPGSAASHSRPSSASPTTSRSAPSGPSCCRPASCVSTSPGEYWDSGCLSFPHWLRDQARYAMIRAGRRHFNRTVACSQWVQRVLAMNGIEADHLPLSVPASSPGFRRAPAGEPLPCTAGGSTETRAWTCCSGRLRRCTARYPRRVSASWGRVRSASRSSGWPWRSGLAPQ